MTRPKYKVIEPMEFLLDHEGSIIGTQEMVEMSREELLKLYPDFREKIERAVKP